MEDLRVLGNLLKVPDFDYQSSEEVRDELRECTAVEAPEQLADIEAASALSVKPAGLSVPINSVDALVRRAESLQLTRSAKPGWRKTA